MRRISTLFAAIVVAIVPAVAGATTAYDSGTEVNAPSGPSPSEFGTAVAVSADGTTMVVGDFGAGDATGTGAAFVYTRSGSTWSHAATLTTTTGTPLAFGWSVGISGNGDTIIVGDQQAGSAGTGAVFVFERPSSGTWATTSSPTATLTTSTGSPSVFGTSLALSGDAGTIVVGDTGAGGASGAGAVFVYERPGSGTWATKSTPTATLTTTTGIPAAFGHAVATTSTAGTIVVGDLLAGGAATGAVFVYERPGSGTWATTSSPTATLTTTTGIPQGVSSVATTGTGDLIVVGDSDAGSGTGAGGPGAVFVYERPGSGTWATKSTPTATLTTTTGTPADFGWSVATTGTGDLIIVGDPKAGTASDGAAFVYERPGSGTWATTNTPATTLIASSGTPQDLGTSVAISDGGDALAAGDPNAGGSGGAAGPGAVFVFDRVGAATAAFSLTDALAMQPQNIGFPTTAVGLTDVTLAFDSASATGWKVRGQDAAWTASIQLLGDFTDGTNTVVGENLQIKIESADISPSSTNPTSNVTSFTALPDPTPSSGSPGSLTILTSTSGGGSGIFTFTPEFQLTVPGSTPSGSYGATLVTTVVAGP